MVSEGLEIELSDFEAETAKLKDDHSQLVVEMVIRGIPTVLEIPLMSLAMAVSRILLEGSISTNPFNPVRHPVDLRKDNGGI